MRHLADHIAGSPALAAAATKSLLGGDPDVEQLRLTIGRHWYELFDAALGGDADLVLLRTLTFVFSGAPSRPAWGILGYDELGPQVEAAFGVVVRGNA